MTVHIFLSAYELILYQPICEILMMMACPQAQKYMHLNVLVVTN
jgi:hypothetical protein